MSPWWLLLIVPGTIAVAVLVTVCVIFAQIAKGFRW